MSELELMCPYCKLRVCKHIADTIAVVERDRERLDWLDNKVIRIWDTWVSGTTIFEKDNLRKAIDKAMEAESATDKRRGDEE